LRKNPVEIGEAIGAYLVEKRCCQFRDLMSLVLIQNIELNDSVWVDTFNAFSKK
jgi:hypothetical protein